MNLLWKSLLEVGAAIERTGHGYALVGGLAVSARADPRFTRDIDLTIAVTDDRDAERLIRSVARPPLERGFLVEQESVGRLASVRLTDRSSVAPVALDLLFASSGIEHEIVAAAERLELAPGVMVPVARVGHLLALKLLARDDATRPQDALDIRSLLAVASADELELALHAARLIEERGYAQGRDLRALLAACARP